MSPTQNFLLGYLLNSLWQAPLLFAAAWLLSRAVRRTGPAIEHRIWAAALILEAVLPACIFNPRTLLQLFQRQPAPTPHATGITTTIGTGYVHGALRLQPTLLNALTLAYLAVMLFLAARLAWRLRQTQLLARNAQPIALPAAAAQTWQRCAQRFAVPDAHLAAHPSIAGPITIGIFRRAVLLPTGWAQSLPQEDLAAALAHEFAHMQRRDFARNLFYELLALPVAYHPILWITRSRLTESREILCDDLAAAAVDGKKNYAHSLLRVASLLTHPPRPSTYNAIGIFDANNFERRVMNLTRNHLELRTPRRIATTAACIALGLTVCLSALAMRLDVDKIAKPLPPVPAQPAAPPAPESPAAPPAPASSAAPEAPAPPPEPTLSAPPASPSIPSAEPDPAPQADSPLRVASGIMAGNILTKAQPVYPPDAKAAHIQGAVVLHAIIGIDGTVENLVVISGPKELQSSAIDAVKQWTFQPYLLNGNPTEVDTTIEVNYQLAD